MSRGAADVIIIGGGLMGASSALFLRRRGLSVILLESDLIGRQASGTNFGNVRRQGRPLHQLPLANRAREVWLRLPELVGEDCEFVRRGHLRIALDDAMAEEMAAYARDARDCGLALEMLSGNALRSRFPWLGPRAIAGSFAPLDGHANPRLTAPAIARAAGGAGALVREHSKVVAAARSGEDFEVETERGERHRAPTLLLTAGAWSGAFAEAFGEAVPLTVKGPQMSVTEPAPYFLGPAVGVASRGADETVYFRQVERGNIVIGGPRHGPASIATGRANVLPENTLIQLAKTREHLPLLSRLSVIRVWSGVEGYLPDAEPVMGPSPIVPGLFYAFGFSGAGFQLGPGVGEVMAELIATGRSPIALDPYRMERFAGPAA